MNGTEMTYEVEANTVAEGLSSAFCKSSHFDFDSGAEPSPVLFGPAELFAAAFAACVLKNLSRFAEILPFAYSNASVHVTATREDAPPRISQLHYLLRITTAEPQHRIDLLHRNIAKHGTIFNTVAAACEVSGDVVAVRAVSPEAAGN